MQLKTIIPSVILCAAALRVGVVLYYSPRTPDAQRLPDERQYLDMATALSAGQGLRDELGFQATRMPLYPGFLSLFAGRSAGPTAALLVQALLSAALAGVVAVLAARVAGQAANEAISARCALAAVTAGALAAADPFLVYFARYTLTENLFAAALAAVLLCSWPLAFEEHGGRRLRWLGAGVLLALCVYLRPSVSAFVVPWSAWLLWSRRGAWPAWRGVALALAVVLLALSPWWLRNARMGRPTLLTQRLGISLYDGLGPQATGASDLAAVKQAPEVRNLDEVQWNRHFLHAAWRAAADDPARVLQLAAVKLARTWRPWPGAADHQAWPFKVLGGSWTAAILLAAVAGMAALYPDRRSIVGLLLPALYFTALHMVFVGSVRYRLPAMPLIEVLSAIGIVSIWAKVAARRSRGRPGRPRRG